MFENDIGTSYLNETAGHVENASIESDKWPQIRNPNHPSAVTESGFEPYWKRANVAQYSDRYRPLAPVKSQYDVRIDYGNPTEEDMGRTAFQSGILMSSLIILGAVAGYSLESKIESKIKVAGYGSLIGAVTANALRYSFAKGTTASFKDGMKALLGASIPLAPVALAMITKRPLKREMILLVGGSSAIMGGYVIFDNLKKKFGF